MNVFSGAGLSGTQPAGLPLGAALRDIGLSICHDAALKTLPTVDTLVQGSLPTTCWKLEYVLGRIEGSAGPHALSILEALRVDVPNEAHMLCAAALALGGTHVTVNLDDGVERAYGLLAGSTSLPSYAHADFQSKLLAWRAALPVPLPRLTVLATEQEFADWAKRASGGTVLAKLHGSVGLVGQGPAEPVVSDFVELRELSRARQTSLELAAQGPLLISGYSGGDGDCYQPLLRLLSAGQFRWLDPNPTGRLIADLGAIGSRQPEVGTAVDGLRDDPALSALPSWPAINLGAGSRSAAIVARWASSLTNEDLTDAYAWMLLDARECDAAANLSLAQWTSSTKPRALRRYADARFHESGERNKRQAARAYKRLLRPGPSEPGLRTHALQRYGASYRGMALRDGRFVDICRVLLAPAGAWCLSWIDGADASSRSGSRAVVSHFLLRLAEVRMARNAAPAATRAAAGAALLLRPRVRQEAVRAGHWEIYGRLQVLELRALHVLLGGRASAEARRWLDELRVIETVYVDMNNPMGTANALAAQALAAAAFGDADSAAQTLDAALASYLLGGRSDPSGEELVARRRLIVDQWRVS